jgi:O-antigen/teichoic acid export membrane protein
MGVTSVTSNIVMLRYLVRYLPAPEAGVWLLFLTMSSYLAIFDFGISPTIGREISLAVGQLGISEEERNSRIRDLIATGSRILTFLAGALAIVCGAAGYFYLRSVVDFSTALGHRTSLSWFIFVLAVAASVSGEIWLAALYGFGSVAVERMLRTLGYALWVVLSILVLKTGGGLIGLSLAWFYAFGIRLAARQVFMRSHSGFRLRGRFDWQLGKSVSGNSLKYAGTLVGGTLILFTDNIVIASVLGPAAVPDYYAVARLVSACLAVSLLISTASSPFISVAYSAGRMNEVRRITMRNVRIALALMVTGGSFLAFFGKPLIQLWIGEGNFVGYGVLLVMLCAMTLEAHHVSLATATMACDRIPFIVPALIAGVLNLALSFPLAYRFGLVGVALGTFLAQVLTNYWYVPMYSIRFLRIKVSEYAAKVILPSLALFAGVAGCDDLIFFLLRGDGRLTRVAAGMILNGSVLGGFLFFTGVLHTRKGQSTSADAQLREQRVDPDAL